MKRFEVLDSFRGLAAIFIVLYHLRFYDSITEWSFFRGSNILVEFFFVLSGFVLAHSYGYKKDLKFKNFLISRTFRLLPLHVVTLVAFILFETLKWVAYQKGFHFNIKPFTDVADPRDIIPNLLLLQSWLPNVNELSWNYPSWSISMEYYMYIIFFMTLFLKERIRYIAWLMISLVMFSFIYKGSTIEEEILKGLSCFFAGNLVYLLYKNIHDEVTNSKTFFTILEFILLLSVIITLSSKFDDRLVFASLLFCIIVFVFAFERGFFSDLLKHKIFLYFGKLSYSIYMTHALIILGVISFFMVLEKILKVKFTVMSLDDNRMINLGNALYNHIGIIIILGIIIFVSTFTYKYIEQKGQAFGRELNKK